MDAAKLKTSKALTARGAPINPAGRFETFETITEYDDRADLEAGDIPPLIATQVYRDTSKTIISTKDSPDVGMDTTLNPYRGCEHGCIYCYARPTHEYHGLSAGIDFETKIFAKYDAAKLLIEKLSHKNWQPRTISLSGVTDPYQPIERKLRITRNCLEVLVKFRNPTAIVTKNVLVTRDIDLLQELNSYGAAGVYISVTTLQPDLARRMEPRAASPIMRLRTVEALKKAGIPVGIIIGPVLPGLTEHEIPTIIEAAAGAGAEAVHYTMLRLPYGVRDLFQTWLQENYPDRAQKVLNRMREIRGGKLYNAEFGTRMIGEGQHAEQIAQLVALYRKKYGLDKMRPRLSAAHFNHNAYAKQPDLFSLSPCSAKSLNGKIF